MLNSLAKQTDSDYVKVIEIPRHAFNNLVNK